jgi:hypothetical protein
MLGLADLLLHFGLDAALHGHHFELFVEQFADAAQTMYRIGEFQ